VIQRHAQKKSDDYITIHREAKEYGHWTVKHLRYYNSKIHDTTTLPSTDDYIQHVKIPIRMVYSEQYNTYDDESPDIL